MIGDSSLQQPMQSVPITTKVASSNHDHGEVYSIQHYVIKIASDLWQVGGFLRLLRFTPPNKTDLHDITETLLKVALNTITPYHQNMAIFHTLHAGIHQIYIMLSIVKLGYKMK